MIAQKIRKAKTDPEPLPDDPALLDGRPEARNLVGIYGRGHRRKRRAGAARRFAGQGFGAFKPALADALVALLAPLRGAARSNCAATTGELDRFSPTAPSRAAALAAPTLAAGLSRGRPARLTQRFIDSSARFIAIQHVRAIHR